MRVVLACALSKKCDTCGSDNRSEANYCLKCGRSFFAQSSSTESLASELPAPACPSPSPFFPEQRTFSFCRYHPGIASQFNCRSCGTPLCLVCVRTFLQQPYCPKCFANSLVMWQLGTRIMPVRLQPYVYLQGTVL